MTYEEKVKMLEIFNIIDESPWTDEKRRKFMFNYQALAASMTGPIVKRIDESGLRKSIKVIKHNKITWVDGVREINPLKVKLGTHCLAGFGYTKAPYIVGEDGLVKTITAQDSYELKLGNVTLESIEQMVEKVARAMINYETEAVNTLKAIEGKSKQVILYIIKDFEAFADPTLVKRQKIGIYGWQEFAVVAE